MPSALGPGETKSEVLFKAGSWTLRILLCVALKGWRLELGAVTFESLIAVFAVNFPISELDGLIESTSVALTRPKPELGIIMVPTANQDIKELYESPHDVLDLEPRSRSIAYESDADGISGGELNDTRFLVPRPRGHGGHVINDRVVEGEMVKSFAALLPPVFDFEWQRAVFSRQTRNSAPIVR